MLYFSFEFGFNIPKSQDVTLIVLKSKKNDKTLIHKLVDTAFSKTKSVGIYKWNYGMNGVD